MKRLSKYLSVGVGVAAIALLLPLLSSAPVLASLQQAGETIAQVLKRPKMELKLSVEKQVGTPESKAAWQSLEGRAAVHPGDVLRYTVSGENVGQNMAKKLVVTQPIPKQMTYVMDSSTNANRAATTFSIDNGKTFVVKPTIPVQLADGRIENQPAPAEAYTHVRWDFGDAQPSAKVQANYQVKVR